VAGSILGTRVQRKEDPKFLTTGGVYVDDLRDELLTGALHVVYARSPVAHGTINSIDTDDAESMPGVVGVFTAESLGLEPVPSQFNPTWPAPCSPATRSVSSANRSPPSWPTRYEQATDAAQAIFVDIDFLPALIDIEASMASDTLIYEAAGSNAMFDTTAIGMPENTARTTTSPAARSSSPGRFLNQRVAPCPLEVRGSAATWVDGRLHQWLSTQHAQGVKLADRCGQRRRAGTGPDDHPRRRRRVRRQDRLLRRGDAARVRSPGSRRGR
jgi:aerobic carbon-monoxide dehydrogenase large subunit